MSIKGSPALQLLTAYRLVKQIIKPWEEWDAYKVGLIDKKGKKIKDSKTDAEHNSFPVMTVFAANIKRLVQKIPGGGSKFGSLAAAMFMLKEEAGMTDESVFLMLEKLDIEFEAPQPKPGPWLSESVYYGNDLLRHVHHTKEKFLGFWDIYEGTDILTGEIVRFIDADDGEARQK